MLKHPWRMVHHLCCWTFLLVASFATANPDYHAWRVAMPYAPDEQPDVARIDLSGTWQFKADPEGVGEVEGWYRDSVDAADWRDFRVPGIWNEGRDAGVAESYNGFGWFRRTFEAPSDWRDSDV